MTCLICGAEMGTAGCTESWRHGATQPQTTNEVIAWLRAHPEEPFYTLCGRDELVVGTRNDDGELNAYECKIVVHAYEHDPAPRVSGKRRGRP